MTGATQNVIIKFRIGGDTLLTFSLNLDCSKIDYKDVNFNPKTQAGEEYLSSFFLAVALGRNKTNSSDAYGIKSRNNSDKYRKYIEVELVNDEEFEKFKSNTLPEIVLKQDVSTIDEFLDEDEKKEVLKSINEMEEYLEIEAGVNLILLLKRAVEGNEIALEKLRNIIKEFSMDDLILKLLRIPNWWMLYIKDYGNERWWLNF